MTIERYDTGELAPIVAKVLGQPQVDSFDWQVQPVGGAGGSQYSGVGLQRLSGTAQIANQRHTWSTVVKIFNPAAGNEDSRKTANIPSAPNYWKREILAYESGMLPEGGGTLVAPRCYGATERSDGEWRLWLEDVCETSKRWTIARHGLAARHLGQFNGAHLAEHSLPEKQPWFYSGRVRDWGEFSVAYFEEFRRYASTTGGQSWLDEETLGRMQHLLDNHTALVTRLDRLPVTFCHHDAYRRNLLARDRADGTTQTVAIDWSYAGHGTIGEDPGVTTAVALTWLEVDADRAVELDQTVFESYLDGLRDSGWQGDPRLARFAYLTTAAVAIGLRFPILVTLILLTTEEGCHTYEAIVGHPLEDIFSQLAIVQPFLLDLGDEALQLMEEL